MDSTTTIKNVEPYYVQSKMKIDILEVVAKSDGSAEISLDIDRNGLDLLVKEGFISMMNKGLKLSENNE